MNAIKIINRLSLAIYFMFFPVFWTIKTVRKSTFNRRKAKAIKQADKLHKEQNVRAHVVQLRSKFIVGTRNDLRRKSSKYTKKLSKVGLIFDYKQAIIYTT